MPKKTTITQTAEDKRLQSRLQETPIAVVGMASIFADAKNVEQYWDNILDSVDSIIDVPESRWNVEDYYSEDKTAADKTYCKRGAFMPEVDFDPMEFGLPPNILEVTDIAQLIALIVAKEVIDDAGIGDESGYDRDKVGITLGVGGGLKQIGALNARLQYPVLEKVLDSCGVADKDRQVIIDKFKKAYIPWQENSFPGMLGNVVAGRVANRFDLGGTNCTVDAACAGSLAAMKLAVSDLLEYRSEMMISGGICCDNSPFMYMSFSKTPAFTTNDNIRPFDHTSNGMMVGEGVGMVMLKRLEDAERDGDKIYAVLKGIGTSSDGRFKSIYAPRPEGQAKALKRAYEDAAIDPKTVGLIEAHGTGTLAGDAAEFRGLSSFFGDNNNERDAIALGSVKSQIGHTKSAAGAAGFIKLCLALHHKVLPATINVEKPSEQLDLADSPFYINSETRPWLPRVDGAPRRAGVSSFGFGGTNFHFVLEEYQQQAQGNYRLSNVEQSFLFAANDKAALQTQLQQAIDAINLDDEDEADIAFNILAHENGLRPIDESYARIGFAAKAISQATTLLNLALEQLKANDKPYFNLPQGVFFAEKALNQGKVVALFSGQGSQYLNMGKELACEFPEVMASFARMDQCFAKEKLKPLSKTCFPVPVFSDSERKAQAQILQQTQFAQPAIGSLSAGLYTVLSQAGFKADITAGHSFGELSALWAAGVLSDDDYTMLAMQRGQAMKAPEGDFDAGTMAAVMGDTTAIAKAVDAIEGVEIANYNTLDQVVIAGASAKVEAASKQLKADGFKVIALPVSAAFHTPLVAHAQKPFAKAVANAKFNKPKAKVYSNATAKAHSGKPEDMQKALQEHILQSVRFSEQLQNIYQDGGRVFVEFGPKNTLSKMVENVLADKTDVFAIALNANAKQSSDSQLRKAVVQLAVLGLSLENFDQHQAPKALTFKKKSPMSMKLSAASYVSDKTQKAFTDALNDGYKIAQTEEKVVEKVVEKIVEVPVPATGAQPAASENSAQSPQTAMPTDAIYQQQKQLLDIHQQYMKGPEHYAQTVQQVLQQNSQGLPDNIAHSLQQLHDLQVDTLKVHEQFLHQQAQSYSASAAPQTAFNSQVSMPVAAPAPVTPQPAAQAPTSPSVAVEPEPAATAAPAVSNSNTNAQAASLDAAALEKTMLGVVAEKTGYPETMLELSMDMEADLGIDSIKRVEILGAVQDAHSELPELDPEALTECRTLGEVVSYMQSTIANMPAAALSSAPSASATAHAPAANIDLAALENTMLNVVAEKTGYPESMLELAMDMEADLGIDSIKRVEILGAVQDAHSELPELDPEALTECRTLGEVVSYMQSTVANMPAAAPAIAATTAPSATATASAAAANIDLAALENTMLNVVAEKTGYPQSMLELAMDMEADLGIDSIKRVEILGAVQDAHSELPELDPEALTECRTLGEVVSYMQSTVASMPAAAPAIAATAAPSATATASAPAATIDLAALENTMLEVVAEKTGYPQSMLELAMDMEADLGIDSIKRVEILGAVQDAHSELPELDPEALTECRTLGEVVSYMQSTVSAAQSTGATEAKAPAASAQTSSSVNVEQLEAAMLAAVAEKTGYPESMLELSMDMEADLGIDSIKRVEILGAVQDALAGLPEVSPETLAEMRTLQEVVDAFASSTDQGTEAIANEPKAETTNAASALQAPSATVALEAIETPFLQNNNVLAKQHILLVDDGHGTACALSDMLLQHQAKVSVLTPSWVKANSKKALPQKVNALSLESADETLLKAVLPEGLTTVVILQPKQASKTLSFDAKAKESLRLAFLLAKLSGLKQTSATHKAFITVSRQGGKLGYQEGINELCQAGLAGLSKTLKHEWPEVYCRHVDADNQYSGEKLAGLLFQELLDADTTLAEVALFNSQRLQPVAKACDSYQLSQANRIDSSDIFLVSGGAKGVTAHCVKALAKASKARFILLGRQALPNKEPSWANNCQSETELKQAAIAHLQSVGEKPTPVAAGKLVQPILGAREITETLEAIKHVGGKADYLAVDVADSKALKAGLKKLVAENETITGIIHGAGVLADNFIEQKTLAEFNRVFDTKVQGLQALLDQVDAKKLKHLVMFSSAAGFYGNEGQSDYAMANEVLNKAALRFKQLHPSAQVLSLNFGPWDGGMVTEQLKRMFEERGVYVIPLDAGASLLVNELNASDNRSVQVLVGNAMQGGESAQAKKPQKVA